MEDNTNILTVQNASGYKWGDFPVSEKASREVMSLPMHPFLTESDQDKIVEAVKTALL